MIGRLLRGCVALLVYACVATVIAQAILLAYFGRKWHLDRNSVVEIMAIAYGIDLLSAKEETQKQQEPISPEQPSYEQIVESRAMKFRNLELREQALQTAVSQSLFEQNKVAQQQKRQKDLKESFDEELHRLQQSATGTGTEEARRILETVKPKQAKELLAQMLEEKKLDQAVVLLAAMPDAKRAKILGEFKTPEETVQIGEILRRIREGLPTADLAGETQKKLNQPGPAGR